MKYVNEHGDVLKDSDIDLNQGYVKEEKRLIAHHDATPEIPKESHWQDVIKDGVVIGQTEIIDRPYTPAKDAWDEYEWVGVYVLYTDEELKANAEKEKAFNLASAIDSQARTAIMMLVADKASSLDDSQVSQIGALFPDWQAGVQYHTGDIVRYFNGLWRALQDSTGQPGYSPDGFTAGWKRIGEPDSNGVFPWSQPLGSTDAYRKGNKVTYDDATWTTTVDYNVWQPGVYGWVKDSSSSDTVAAVEEWPTYVQPSGTQDAYHNGDKVTFNGKHYVSVIDSNVWNPDAYPQGWKEA